MSLATSFREVRRVSTPWCVVKTNDYRTVVRELMAVRVNGENDFPVYLWTCMDGAVRLQGNGGDIGTADEAPSLVLKNASALLPEWGVFFLVAPDDSGTPGHFWTNPFTVQAVCNLRDAFKKDHRVLVILSIDGFLPPLFSDDVPLLVAPLPTREELVAMGRELLVSQKVPVDEAVLNKGANLCLGLNRFAAEGALARKLSRKEGLNLAGLATEQREIIEQASGKGLTFERGPETFADIGGLKQIKKFSQRLFEGKRPPTVVVRIEEIEKAMAGSGTSVGDSTGVSQDQLGVLLTAMEDNNWSGYIAVGPAGCLHGDTLIHDPIDGTTMTVKERLSRKKGFHVWSRKNDGSVTIAKAFCPTAFPAAPMLKFRFKSGRSITVTHGHRFWDGAAYTTASEICSRLHGCVSYRLPTISDTDLLVQMRGARHWKQKAEGSTANYSGDYRLCDERLLSEGETFQSHALQQGDARQHSHFLSLTDGLAGRYTNRHLRAYDHLSTTSCLPLSELRSGYECAHHDFSTHRGRDDCYFLGFLRRFREKCLLHKVEQPSRFWRVSNTFYTQALELVCSRDSDLEACIQKFGACRISAQSHFETSLIDNQRTFAVGAIENPVFHGGENLGRHEDGGRDSISVFHSCLLNKPLTFLHRTHELSQPELRARYDALPYSVSPANSVGVSNNNYTGPDQIVSIEDVGAEEYYDFHVPGYENYWAEGLFHHNSGKSFISKAMGNTYGVPTISLDLGALKGQYVGLSEQKIRKALSILKSFAGEGAFFVATSNGLNVIPAELRRRFRFGIWYFDLLTAEERAAVWDINLKKFGLSAKLKRPNDTDYTGSDIRNVCDLAARLSCSLTEAAEFIVPVAVSDPAAIVRLRSAANGKFLSASSPGPYRLPEASEGRAIVL